MNKIQLSDLADCFKESPVTEDGNKQKRRESTSLVELFKLVIKDFPQIKMPWFNQFMNENFAELRAPIKVGVHSEEAYAVQYSLEFAEELLGEQQDWNEFAEHTTNRIDILEQEQQTTINELTSAATRFQTIEERLEKLELIYQTKEGQ